MPIRTALIAVTLVLLSAAVVRAAGLQPIEVPAGEGGEAIYGLVWSPCSQPAAPMQLGRLEISASPQCPVNGTNLPLILISHGYGGNDLGHHDTAEALADAGFVAVAINHPIDTTPPGSRANTIAWFTERPRDIKRVIDFMLNSWADRSKLNPDRIGFFGFSRGGHTGLVLIGANPDLRQGVSPCPPDLRPVCDAAATNPPPPTAFTHDARIKAAVLADPALPQVFTLAGLQQVIVPIQLWASERSGDDPVIGVTEQGVADLRDRLPSRPDFHLVSGAGHFAFLAPCPSTMAQRVPRFCVDAAGFDRVVVHNQLDAAIVAFFCQHLPAVRR